MEWSTARHGAAPWTLRQAGCDSLPHPSRFVSSDPPAQSHTNHWRLA